MSVKPVITTTVDAPPADGDILFWDDVNKVWIPSSAQTYASGGAQMSITSNNGLAIPARFFLPGVSFPDNFPKTEIYSEETGFGIYSSNGKTGTITSGVSFHTYNSTVAPNYGAQIFGPTGTFSYVRHQEFSIQLNAAANSNISAAVFDAPETDPKQSWALMANVRIIGTPVGSGISSTHSAVWNYILSGRDLGTTALNSSKIYSDIGVAGTDPVLADPTFSLGGGYTFNVTVFGDTSVNNYAMVYGVFFSLDYVVNS